MIKIDLITGFLGSGKTTFIKQYAQYLIDQGYKIGIIENDYGAVNIDMMLLQDLHCDLEMISGGCDQETHKRRYRAKLISMGMLGFDRIIVEPSGIYDIDEFFDVLYDEPLNKWYEIGSVITLVKSTLKDSYKKEYDYLLASEIAHAGKIVFSFCEESTKLQQEETIVIINDALKEVRCSQVVEDVFNKPMSQYTHEDYEMFMHCGYKNSSYVKRYKEIESQYESLFFLNVHKDIMLLKESFINMMANEDCGNIIRIKGFTFQEGQWYEWNINQENIHINPIPEGQEIMIVIGNNLNKDKIESHLY